MIKTIISLIPFAIFCLLGANLYVKYLVEKQFDEIEEELFKEQNNKERCPFYKKEQNDGK